MTFRFLIDECLSPVLAQIARDCGYCESTCVRDRGLSGTKDHDLVRFVIANDFTLVTHNAMLRREKNETEARLRAAPARCLT